MANKMNRTFSDISSIADEDGRTLPEVIGPTCSTPIQNDIESDNELQEIQFSRKRSKGTKLEFGDDSKYPYSKLGQVWNMFPIAQEKFVYVYGVIVHYWPEKEQLTIMDETWESFELSVNVVYKSSKSQEAQGVGPNNRTVAPTKKLILKPGDIIRIHRVQLQGVGSFKSFRVSDLVVFESFKKSTFCPLFLSTNPTFSFTDRTRVDELTTWSLKKLLCAEVMEQHDPIMNKTYTTTNAVFQVIATLQLDNRVIIACWSGKPISCYPCRKLVEFEIILKDIGPHLHTSSYTSDYIQWLYSGNMLTFITVYGLQRITARLLLPMDTIVVYNLEIKPDNCSFGKYSFVLKDDVELFGCTIRVCEYQSRIAKELRERIEEYYMANYKNRNIKPRQSHIMSFSDVYSDSSDGIDEGRCTPEEDNLPRS